MEGGDLEGVVVFSVHHQEENFGRLCAVKRTLGVRVIVRSSFAVGGKGLASAAGAANARKNCVASQAV